LDKPGADGVKSDETGNDAFKEGQKNVRQKEF
jgi:hypothetical protein